MANKWSREELKAAIQAYIDMRDKQLAGEPYVKAQYIKALVDKFGRTKSAFEFRMQNISYLYDQQGREWVQGFPPASHIGANVGQLIEGLIAEIEGTPSPNEISFDIKVNNLKKKGVPKRPEGNEHPEKTASSSVQFKRDPAVVAWVLAEAKGLCECCGQPAPFKRADGSPFLEVHHVVRLKDKGPDTIENAVAICPNCHRALHYAVDRRERREMLYSLVTRLRKPSTTS